MTLAIYLVYIYLWQGCGYGSAWIHIIFGSWIRICIRVKSWIRIRISKNSEALEAQNRAVEVRGRSHGGLEAKKEALKVVCREGFLFLPCNN
jgi:hypothetical protein